MEFTIKELEIEKHKQSQEIANLEKDLLKTDETQEKVITEILEKQRMKEDYDAILLNLQSKNETLVQEKQDQNAFFERKTENLLKQKEEATKELFQLQSQVSSLKRDNEKLLNELNDKNIEIKEIGIQYENQMISIRQNFEESLDNFQTNFRIQSGDTDCRATEPHTGKVQ
jgi:chromosome segregation ATPase